MRRTMTEKDKKRENKAETMAVRAALLVEELQRKRPLVHCITNYVTANDCANILLAIGASPIMADDPEETGEIAASASALVLNMGTPSRRKLEAMVRAGKSANEAGIPVILDPVGAGASALRTSTALRLLEEVKPTVVRGNISEIKTLALGSGSTKGVDADLADRVTPENLDQMAAFAREFSARCGAVLAITGAIDLVADPDRVFCIYNGHPDMSRVTGTGCQLSAVTAAYLAANPDDPLTAAAAAVCAMGLCGEIAHARLSPLDGNASYRTYIIDAMYNLTPEALEQGARYEMR